MKAAEMMLRHIALADKADKLAAAMLAAETAGVIMTGTPDGATADEYTAKVLENL